MKILKASQPRPQEGNVELTQTVSEIIARVRTEGDQALINFNEKFDRCTRSALRVSKEEIKHAYEEATAQDLADMSRTQKNLETFARAQLNSIQPLENVSPEPGIMLGHRIIPVESVCCYVPAGSYPLFTTAQHLAVPAKVSGVNRVAACSPVMKGTNQIHPLTLVALDMAGVDEIYAIGGAQAIGAFAYGTQQIPPVDMIVGPGNIYVTEAKRQCYGQVGIDFIAGPSEVLAICDETADPDIIAADMLAQSEHDLNAKGFVLTTDEAVGLRVIEIVKEQLKTLETAGIAAKSWENYGEVILVESLQEAVNLCNQYAPEHLELCVKNPQSLLPSLTNYGSLFIGHNTAEVYGDYLSGTNHTLPTVRAARYTGGVSVYTFLKICTHQWMTTEAMMELTPPLSRMARKGFMVGHARAAEIRYEKAKGQ